SGLSMHLVVIPPGGRSEAHSHLDYETGIYVLEGTVQTRWGPALEHEVVSRAGDVLFIPPGMPHEAINLSATEPARAVVARNDPAEQDRVEPYVPRGRISYRFTPFSPCPSARLGGSFKRRTSNDARAPVPPQANTLETRLDETPAAAEPPTFAESFCAAEQAAFGFLVDEHGFRRDERQVDRGATRHGVVGRVVYRSPASA